MSTTVLSKTMVLLLLATTGSNSQTASTSIPSDAEDLLEDPDCGIVDNDLLSQRGSTTGVDVPWTAVVVARSELQSDQTYAGVIISPSIIMTSANYFVPKDTKKLQILPFKDYFVSTGTRKFGDPAHVDQNAQIASITHVSIQPGFSPGNWSITKNEVALLHLKQPLNLTRTARPICLPNKDQMRETQRPGNDSVVISGWNKNIPGNMFLRIAFQPEEKCRKLWDTNDESNHAAYVDRACAFVTQENDHLTCIHKGVATARLIKDRYYFAGTKNILYSTNKTRKCYPGAHYYIWTFSEATYSWIRNNTRCGSENFTCGDGKCVSTDKICNRDKDCPDGSDEEPLFCRGLNYCPPAMFACGVYGKCIPKDQVQDGICDCEECEDEVEDEADPRWTWIYVGIGVACILIIVITLLLYRYVTILKNRIRNLTQKEIDEFKYGPLVINDKTCDSTWEKSESSYVNSSYVNNAIHTMPWNTRYEISSKLLKIKNEIDRGNFGIVYKAELCKKVGDKNHYINMMDEDRIEVAVKTHLPSVDADQFKTLLSELKILAHVGSHEHVVGFLGACTEQIKRRQVYVVVEYCPNKSIGQHLQRNKECFLDIFRQDQVNQPAPDDHQAEVYPCIFREVTNDVNGFLGIYQEYNKPHWYTPKETVDIICGLPEDARVNTVSKSWNKLILSKIVHGDLAARNVLMSSNMTAKISDFGLSRQLLGSEVYVKRTHEPVPWKWLAIESLQSNVFSEKTDIWAYGVTLWEIFSLGETPYKGKTWNPEFVNGLVTGIRLPQPEYSSSEIYNVMQVCWEPRPDDRGSFPQIKQLLSNITRRYTYGTV